jgi:prepilin peptidase CpaA
VKLALLLTWAALIGWSDWHHRRIPNLLSLSAWLVGGAVLLLTGHSLLGAPWPSACWGAAFAAVVTVPAYALGKLGAGDVKFLVAVGLLTSLQVAMSTFLVSSLLAGALAIMWLNRHVLASIRLAAPLSRLLNLIAHGKSADTGTPRFPLGTLIGIGLCLALLERA